MIVLLLSQSPASLRGVITRWLLEVSEGVYVGRVSARVREALWTRVAADLNRGSRAVLIWPDGGDQGLGFRVHNRESDIVDFDGITLVRRPTDNEAGRRRALEAYTDLTERQVDAAMRKWLRRYHPDSPRAAVRQRTRPTADVNDRAAGEVP
ncbi:MAG: type I-E CRISPR-associated endoribonuclease Cas2e [Propionibacteriaceae bacterium]|jgi:CRISPR-associated protein Cas2|nr:type I-E CRISPR-associated endoribonuclease Cas2e [Propionibacteriaceae bacterium]